MKNWLNPNDRAALIGRLNTLTPNHTGKWGTLTAPQVLCHLAEPIRVALGDRKIDRIKSPFGAPGLATLVVWVLPWPKSAPTSPAFEPGKGMTAPTEFQKDKETLLALLQRIVDVSSDGELSPSPVFGNLSKRAWGRLIWRHIDHHLRQFGV